MINAEFTPKLEELNELLDDDASIEEITNYLDQNPTMVDFIRRNSVYDEKDFPESDSNWLPLHKAAVNGKLDALTLFLEKYSFCIDARDNYTNYSTTALHYAIWFANSDCVRLLLEQGSNQFHSLKWDGRQYQSALDFAEVEGDKETIKALQEAIQK